MPTRIAATLFSILVTLLSNAAVVATAAESPSAKTAQSGVASAANRYNKGLLWKIERPGQNPAQKPSHLFGTIHTSDPRVVNLPPPVREAFDAARSFTMEVIVDGAGLTHMAEAMFFNDGRTLT